MGSIPDRGRSHVLRKANPESRSYQACALESQSLSSKAREQSLLATESEKPAATKARHGQ